MARTDLARTTDVRNVEGIGWQLSPIQRVEFNTSNAQFGPKHRLAPTVPGLLSLFAQKSIHAGDTFESSLATDAATVPTYSDGDGDGDFDRAMRSNGDYQPGRAIFYSRHFSAPFMTKGVVDVLYFAAAPTTRTFNGTGEYQGTGEWRIVLRGDGTAILQERAGMIGETPEWNRLGRFRYAPPAAVGGFVHEIEILPYNFPARSGGYGGSIRVRCVSAPRFGEGSFSLLRQIDPETFLYRIRQDAAPTSVNSHPIRLDERRESRSRWQIALAALAGTGTLLGDPISLEGPLGAASDGEPGSLLTLSWRADTPSGTNVTGDLLANGTPLAAAFSGGDGLNRWKSYAIADFSSALTGFVPPLLVPRFVFTGDGKVTPTLFAMWMRKAAVGGDIAPEPFEPKGRITVAVAQGGDDPSGDNATFTLSDEYDDHSVLSSRGRWMVELSTEYPGVDWTDPANAHLRSVLFRGMAVSPEAERRGAEDPENRHSSGEYQEYSLVSGGPWTQLEESFAPQLIDFMLPKDEDAASGRPWKGTDAIYLSLHLSGKPDEMIDVPDLGTRFFVGQEGTKLEPGASLTEFARRTAREMFGAPIVYDPNASGWDDPARWWGMWRMLLPKSAPYKPLAYFDTKPSGNGTLPTEGEPKVFAATAAEAYPLREVEGRMIPGTFIAKGSSRKRTRPPEANRIVVVGGAPDEGGKGGRLQVVFVNPKSYNAIPGLSTADATHPDYAGPCVQLRFVDSRLQTFEGLEFIGRRLLDTLGHGRKLRTFRAPLIFVTDPDDPYQRRPRPLRFYDPVLVNGITYIVRSVRVQYTKDAIQMAEYEVELPGDAPFTPGVATDGRGIMMNALRSATGKAMGVSLHMVPTSPGEGVQKLFAGDYERLPIVGTRAPLVLDPGDPRYLLPPWMMGYDDLSTLGI